ncbi:MAG: efflux RND transporter periplasmic adaptor subunit [Cyclobacteriaceae bacterium]
MRTVNNFLIIILLTTLAYACGSTEAATDKLAELDSLKEQQKELKTQILELEAELIENGQLESTAKKNAVLITTLEMKPVEFVHKVEMRGTVQSRKNVMLTTESPGVVDAIYVKEGETISKGKVLARINSDILKNNLQELETSLELAEVVFERQSNLWKQNIGTEIQYLQVKNQKEGLEQRLKTLKTQLSKTNIVAPFDGVIDDIPVRVGEMAQPGTPVIRLVNPNAMYIKSDVSEAFLGKFKEGDKVEVSFPALGETLDSEVAAVGQVINIENRTFELEVNLPTVDFPIKPNQVSVLNLTDYKNAEAFTIPSKLIQRDSRGAYVYQIVVDGNNAMAKKLRVEPGITYQQQTEITNGLKEGQVIAFEGYRELTEDVLVNIQRD